MGVVLGLEGTHDVLIDIGGNAHVELADTEDVLALEEAFLKRAVEEFERELVVHKG